MKKSSPTSADRYTIPNLGNACRVLRLLSDSEAGLSLTAIREKMGIPHTSALRILRTLQAEGFVHMEGREYMLGAAFLQMGAQHFSGFNLRKAALPALQELVNQTGETAHFCVPSGYQSLILEVLESPNPVRVASRPGTLAQMHCSATGKVFLAYLLTDSLEAVAAQQPFLARTNHTLTDLKQLRDELKQVRQAGYALDNEEYHPGVRCLAAPVRKIDGTVVGSIGITASTQRFTKRKIPRVATQVKAVADGMQLP